MRNALNGDAQDQIAKCINACQEDEDVKVILLHGGRFYSSGNDLTAFQSAKGKPQDMLKMAEYGCKV